MADATSRPRSPMARGIVGALILATFLALIPCTERAINNGDWYRVTQFGGFYPTGWVPVEGAYGFRHEPRFGHSTTMGIMVGSLSFMTRLISAAEFPSALPSAVTHCAYGLGIALVLFGTSFRHRAAAAAVLVAAYFCFGCYLTSFYEETTVLALVPLLCFSYIRMIETGRCLLFAIFAAAIVYSKIQMVIAVPIFAVAVWIGARGQVRHATVVGAFGALIISGILSANSVHAQNKDPNSFNRYYNGVGWSLLESWRWPATEFHGRHRYFYEHQADLQVSRTSLPNRELMGTSFWPTGEDMLKAARDSDQRTRYAGAVREGRGPAYLAHLWRDPSLLPLLVGNTYLTVLLSDYTTAYVRSDPLVPSPVAEALGIARGSALRYLGAICAALLVLWCLIQRRWIVMLIAACIAAIPMLVVMADGFFEFEKHMVPYLMLTPFAVTMALIPMPPRAVAAQRLQSETEQPIRASSRRGRGKGDRPESQGKRAGKRR